MFLATKTVVAAPAGLAGAVTTSALASVATVGNGFLFIVGEALTMTKVQLTIGAVIAAGLGTTAIVERRAGQKLLRENAALAGEKRALDEHTQRLTQELESRRGEPAGGGERKLASLSAEVAALRRQAGDTTRVQADNQRLRAALTAAEALPPAPVAPAIIAKESWRFAGYADPESAFQSSVWAMSQANITMFLAGMVPDGAERRKWEGRSQEERLNGMKVDTDKVTGFRIVDREVVSDDEVILAIYAQGLDETGKFRFRRLGNEWRLDGPATLPKGGR